jgi:Mlc titration factor MtfA (ptsG expression regulator)
VRFFSWLEARRRRRLLETPFPEAWHAILSKNLVHFGYLDSDERTQLRELVQVFVAEKYWEGCGGLELDDEIRVTIAGQACLLLLGLDHGLYQNVETILVYPSTVMPKRVVEPMFEAPVVVNPVVPLIGEAHHRGPVILAWDAVRRGGRHPDGHNVVYHEFAHKIDMADGAVDGVPPVATRQEYDRWVTVCTREYEALRSRFEAGLPTLLNPYGGTNLGEFFAVATEFFFDRPTELAEQHAELYDVLRAFYRQDPGARERAALSGSEVEEAPAMH